MCEFIYFLQLSCMNSFFLAEAASPREPRARAASVQCELRARIASRKGKAQAPNQAAPNLCRSDPIHLNLNLDT
jgi:hypothetical protein